MKSRPRWGGLVEEIAEISEIRKYGERFRFIGAFGIHLGVPSAGKYVEGRKRPVGEFIAAHGAACAFCRASGL